MKALRVEFIEKQLLAQNKCQILKVMRSKERSQIVRVKRNQPILGDSQDWKLQHRRKIQIEFVRDS